jgi:hypothetical protein
MPSLAQIATKVKDLASAKAPVKTGNLKRKIADFNRPSGMIKESKTSTVKSATIELDDSPPGAEYGKFWNDPNVSKTVRKGKTKNVPKSINFVQKAYDDPKIEKMIEQYFDEAVDAFMIKLGKSISDL